MKNKKSEVHLFIIWSKGLSQKDKIIADISERFNIIRTTSVSWSRQKFSENLSRFYGENLPKNSHKEKHCGTDPFLCILVEDPEPVYSFRETSKGTKVVNTNMFDCKQLYRSWTRGGHRVHGTDNCFEAEHNIFMLFGISIKEIDNFNQIDIPNSYGHDLIGANGWSSLYEAFRALNTLCNYVVLRNFDNLEEEINGMHPDIDVLTDNKNLIVDVINGKKTFQEKYRVQYQVSIAGKKVCFDMRFVGDGYYDVIWQQDILRTRVGKDYFFVPDPKHHFYSLMYHAMVHKPVLTLDYAKKLISLSKNIGLYYDYRNFINFRVLEDLNDFMLKNSYSFTEPLDLTVYFNVGVIKKFRGPAVSQERVLFERKRKIKNKVKNVIRKALHKFLDKGEK